MSWLKAATIAHNKPKHSIIELLKANLGGQHLERTKEVLHASDVTKDNFCPRQWAIRDTLEVQKEYRHLAVAMDVTFQMGLAVERLLVEQWGDGFVVGNWHCHYCGENRSFCKKPTGQCKDGRTHWWRYDQFRVGAPDLGIDEGGIDALFDVGVPQLLIVECKIQNAEDFDKLLTPMPEHRLRTNLYMRMVANSDSVYKNRINVNEARVLYISRGYGRANPTHANEVLPFKEYVVKRDNAAAEEVVKKAKAVKRARCGEGMPSGICSTAMDKVAKNCQYKVQCFSGEYPATFKWETL